MPTAADAAPLDDEMLVMDVANTLRHGIDTPLDPPPAANDSALIARLRTLYLQQGIDVPERVLGDGIAAVATGRFAYAPPRRPFAARLARLYVTRRKWGPPALGLLLVLLLIVGGYYLGYRPYQASQSEQARLELAQNLPARMDELYRAIFDETKVQSAADQAAALRDQGKEAARKGHRAEAEKAIADLTALRDQLQQAYTLKIVDENGVRPGFWTFPANNSEATNYYIVVEAVGADGNVLSVPVTSQDTGLTQTVSRWGLRVPQSVYEAVMADKQDDGTIEHNLVGFKQDGFADVDYVVPVLGGALTQW